MLKKVVKGRRTAGEKAAQALALEEMGLPQPPEYLSKAAAQEWNEIVAKYPPDRFPRGVWPILEGYCVWAVRNRDSMRCIENLPADASIRDLDAAERRLERSSKLVASFGVRLGIARTSMSGRHNNDPETVADRDLPWRE